MLSSSSAGEEGQSVDHPSFNVKFQCQPFIRSNPKVWFRQVDSAFAFSRITNDRSKFNAIFPLLPEDVVMDIPDDMNSYEVLKKHVLAMNGKSSQQKMDEALEECNFDGRKRS